jgi:hypothetical protein
LQQGDKVLHFPTYIETGTLTLIIQQALHIKCSVKASHRMLHPKIPVSHELI